MATKDDLIIESLREIKDSLERLHEKHDSVAGKVEKHEGVLSTLKWGLGSMFAAVVTIIAALFKSHT